MSLSPHGAAGFLPAAERAADAAGAILRRYFRAPLTPETKPDQSPVTIADRQAEAAIRATLSAAHPALDILGEESGLSGPGSRLRWVIDPIDGTRAFLTGRPSFGTLIALMDGPNPILGLIDQPITGERWIGHAGAPTTFRGGAGRIGTRKPRPLAACELSATTPHMFAPADLLRFQSLAAQVARVTYGGDCYAYALLALGQIDIVAEADLKLWDWAALAPIVAGAGGLLTDWRGEMPHPDGDGRVLALADPTNLQEIVAILQPTAPAAGAEHGALP